MTQNMSTVSNYSPNKITTLMTPLDVYWVGALRLQMGHQDAQSGESPHVLLAEQLFIGNYNLDITFKKVFLINRQ